MYFHKNIREIKDHDYSAAKNRETLAQARIQSISYIIQRELPGVERVCCLRCNYLSLRIAKLANVSSEKANVQTRRLQQTGFKSKASWYQ